MSRGLGKVQRFVLAVLDRPHDHKVTGFACWLDADAIAREYADGAPSRSELESVRRAIRRLAAEGRCESVHVYRSRQVRVHGGGRTYYYDGTQYTVPLARQKLRVVLAAHEAFSAEERRERDEQEQRERAERDEVTRRAVEEWRRLCGH